MCPLEINPKELQTRLQDEDFRSLLTQYLESIVKLDFEWTKEPSESTIYGQDKASHAGYHFPSYYSADGTATDGGSAIDIDLSHDQAKWMQAFEFDAKAIAVATQTHTHTATCRKKGTTCRFGFAGQGKALCPITIIDPQSGEIQIKRGNAMVNNHNPLIAAITRSNHDLKPTFLSGYKSLQSMYYMTAYVSKFEDDSSDAVIMEAAWRGLERDNVLPTTDDRERLNRLIIRLSYLRQSSLLFSGAQIAAMFLGIGKEGTHYTNWSFSRISLYAFVNYCHAVDSRRGRVTLSHDTIISEYNETMEDEEDEEGNIPLFSEDVFPVEQEATTHHTSTRESDSSGEASDKPSLRPLPLLVEDYIFRGDELEDYSVYELACLTCAKNTTPSERNRYIEALQSLEAGTKPSWNRRVPFQSAHSRALSRWICFLTHPKVPCIVGKRHSPSTSTNISRAKYSPQ